MSCDVFQIVLDKAHALFFDEEQADIFQHASLLLKTWIAHKEQITMAFARKALFSLSLSIFLSSLFLFFSSPLGVVCSFIYFFLILSLMVFCAVCARCVSPLAQMIAPLGLGLKKAEEIGVWTNLEEQSKCVCAFFPNLISCHFSLPRPGFCWKCCYESIARFRWPSADES